MAHVMAAAAAAEAAASSSQQVPPAGDAAAAAELNHLQWLNAKDQQVLCRAECATAVRDDNKVIDQLRATIEAHSRAIEHCRAASENDPEWFTMDVQDCHSKRIRMLRDILAALEQDAPAVPEEVAKTDVVRGRIYAGYARTAQVTASVATGIQDNERVKTAATGVFSAIGGLATRLKTHIDEGLGIQAEGGPRAPGAPVQSSPGPPPTGAAAAATAAAVEVVPGVLQSPSIPAADASSAPASAAPAVPAISATTDTTEAAPAPVVPAASALTSAPVSSDLDLLGVVAEAPAPAAATQAPAAAAPSGGGGDLLGLDFPTGAADATTKGAAAHPPSTDGEGVSLLDARADPPAASDGQAAH